MGELSTNPYAGVDWGAVEAHKAQLHAHSSHPETEGHSGSDPPDVVIDDYLEAGYSVLALTGHEYNIETTTWPWNDWDRDPDELGMVAVRAAELGGSEKGIDYDLISLFCDLADTSGMSVSEALEAIGERDGLAVFPHPARSHENGEWFVEYVRAFPHLLGVEVVNAADRYPTDRDVYDDLLERVSPDRPVWAFANDDYHGRAETAYTFDRSRNVLLLDSLTERAVKEALVTGRFFYQHRVEGEPPAIERIDHEDGWLELDATGATTVQWISDGEVVKTGRTVDYRSADMGSYVRARVLAASGSETGTQPFLLE